MHFCFVNQKPLLVHNNITDLKKSEQKLIFEFYFFFYSRQAAVLDSDEEDSAEVHFGSSSWQATQATYLNSSLFGVRQFNNIQVYSKY